MGVPFRLTVKEPLSVRFLGAKWRSLLLALLFGSFTLVGGCANETEYTGSWIASLDGSTSETVEASENVCATCLTIEQIVTLGDESPDKFLHPVTFAVRNENGDYLLSQIDGLRVFSETGELLSRIGRQGEGPLEFRDLGPVVLDDAGRIHLFDRRNVRGTVLAEDFSLLETYRLPVRYQAVALIPGTSQMVVNASVRTPDRIGLPLHIVDRSELLKSFGLSEGQHPINATLRLAVDAAGRIFSLSAGRYEVEVWSQDGIRIGAFSRPTTSEILDEPGQLLSPENPPRLVMLDIHVDTNSRLWTIGWVPRPDWRENLEEVRRPDGRLRYEPKDGMASLYRSLVEVIDLDTGELTHAQSFDQLFNGFMEDGLMHGTIYDVFGAPRFGAWVVGFNSRRD